MSFPEQRQPINDRRLPARGGGRRNHCLLPAGAGADTIQGNIIGLDPTGTFPIGDTGGILVYYVPDTLIGGPVPGAGNLISGNAGDGIEVEGATGTIIQGNDIGTDITGTVAIGNTGDGVDLIGAPNTTVGGTNAGDGNLIENNTGDGVYVDDATSDYAILENSIFTNGNLGIELEGYNPSGTPVAGNATNIPVIVSAVAGASTTNVEVQLDDAPNQTYRVEFFSNPAVDHSGFGEGQVYLGYANILTDGSGNADQTITLPVSVPAGLFMTATVTSAAGTSEFSAATEVVAATAAPLVTTNPLSQSLTVGRDASFTVAATGNPTPTVQWMVELAGGSTFLPISGATSDTLDLGAAALAESGNTYEAVFSNGVGSPVTTTAATLTVNLAPVVTTNPLNQTLTVGQDASLTAASSGDPTPAVQWMVEFPGGTAFSPISGATSDTLDLGATARAESGDQYEAVFSNGVGSPATTTAATLTVNLAPAAPVVTTNPLGQSLSVGQDASFTAAASGNPAPTVQWMVALSGGTTFAPITGATSDTLDLGAATLAESGNQYEAVFSNGVGSPATTTAATLTVRSLVAAAPAVTTSPLSQTLTVGQDAGFTASASGNPTPTVQWMVELAGSSTFSPINGATSGTLDLGTAMLAESGNQYEAVFSNGVGSPVTTTAATLTVNPAPAAPAVTTSPLSQTLTVGQDAGFTASASGNPTPTVQWMVELAGSSTFSPIDGATSGTLNLGTAMLAESGNQYEAVFSNGVGSPVTTTAATLTVNPAPAAPAVTTSPHSQTLTVGQDASFTTSASGNPTPTVQWMVELAGSSTFSPINGATSGTLDLGTAMLAESGNQYEAVFSNGVGSPVTTTAATLTVNPAPAAPAVTTSPLSHTLTVGQDASFTASASGNPTPTVQWMVELAGSSTFSPINGATSGTLDLGTAMLAESGNQYEAVFSNGVGSPVTTTAATLTVNPAPAAPAVTTSPLSHTLTVGQDASFTAAASGNPTPTVQWMVELAGSSTFSPINGATSDTLDLGPATLAESGNKYEAVFTNSASAATTTAASLTVNPAQSTTAQGAAPTVVLLQRFGIHMQPTVVVLTFSSGLDPTTAQDVRNYRILGPLGRRFAIGSAVYDPATHTVTLRPDEKINLHHDYQLTVIGTGPGGVASASGTLLDGDGDGSSGSNYAATLNWKNVVLTPAESLKLHAQGLGKPSGPLAHRFAFRRR